MSQRVIIKHNKYGMELVLDNDISFEQLLSEIIEKFQVSGNFFKDTKQVISFKGRQLSENEMLSVVDAIMENSPIQIIGIISYFFQEFHPRRQIKNPRSKPEVRR